MLICHVADVYIKYLSRHTNMTMSKNKPKTLLWLHQREAQSHFILHVCILTRLLLASNFPATVNTALFRPMMESQYVYSRNVIKYNFEVLVLDFFYISSPIHLEANVVLFTTI